MDLTELIAKQGDLADIYYRQRQARKLAKGREENRRAREKRKQKKIDFLKVEQNLAN